MKIHFDTPDFDAQLLRSLSTIYSRGADLGEVLTTAALITEGDMDSWYREWYLLAKRVYEQAEFSKREGHPISACEGFLRASTYFRTASFFLYGAPVDPRLVDAYDKHVEAFNKAVPFLPHHTEILKIPFENNTLTAYFYKASANSHPRPTILTHTGYDGTQQECYFSTVWPALKRGYHVLTFDGPGQGEMLIKKRIPLRHNWETVVSPILDYLLTRPDIDKDHVALIGKSFGGYLAPRAAAFDHRLNALVAFPGILSLFAPITKLFPGIYDLLKEKDNEALNHAYGEMQKDRFFHFKMESKMWIHGCNTITELLEEWKKFTLMDCAKEIQCSTLVCDSENEKLSGGQAYPLFEALICPKEYLLFKKSEGAGEHCAVGAQSLADQRIYDWLDCLFIPAEI